VREARLDDAEALAPLLGQLGYPTSPEAVASRIRRIDSSDADSLLVAELDGKIVGLAGIHVSLAIEYDEPVAKLSAIVVDERYRRRGIGETLVAAVEDESRRRGCCLVFLTTAERRKDAHAFYDRVGFEETGRRFVKLLA
jgi:GNAT superfamily N-acetyltransferase